MQKSRARTALALAATIPLFFKLGGCSDSNALMKNGGGEPVGAQLIERRPAATQEAPSLLAGMKVYPVREGDEKKDSIKVTKEDLAWMKAELDKRPFPQIESKWTSKGADTGRFTPEQEHQIKVNTTLSLTVMCLKDGDFAGARKHFKAAKEIMNEDEKKGDKVFQKLQPLIKD